MVKDENELIADYIAGALLIPKDKLWEELNKDGFFTMNNRQRVKWVNKAAKRYGVDRIVMLKRIKQVDLLMSEET